MEPDERPVEGAESTKEWNGNDAIITRCRDDHSSDLGHRRLEQANQMRRERPHRGAQAT